MTREEAKDFLTKISYALGNMSVEYLTEKDGERMRVAIEALEQEPCDDVCEWFEQYVDIATDIVELRFSDGTVKRAKRGLYMRNIEKSIRKMLINQIANEKKQESKWILVSERLPEENDRYIVYLNTIVFPIRILHFAKNLNEISLDFNCNRKSKKAGWYDYDSENGFFEWTGVEAWMPLPEEPYKIESEGNNG